MMMVGQKHYPNLVGEIDMAGSRWEYTAIGNFEYDTLFVSVRLEKKVGRVWRMVAGPFQFHDGKLDRGEDQAVTFSEDCMVRLEAAVIDAMHKNWPFDF
jgi:hypothetical protein